MRLQTAANWRSLLVSTLLGTGALAKKDNPSVKSTKFDFIPWNVQYFDDSDVLLFEDGLDHVVYRSDNAGEDWKKLNVIPEGKLLEIQMHPYDNKKAYIITNERTHFKTHDRGETWDEFDTESQASVFREALTYHAGDPNRIIFNGMDCTGIFCEETTMYTTDGFSSDAKFLRADTSGCHWAKSSAMFATGDADFDKDRILCVVKGRFSPWRKDYRLLISDNFFRDGQEFEPELEPGRTVQGIVNMAVVTKYLIVAASAEGTDEMALYVSDDTLKWHRAIFPHDHKLTEEAYTVLEGTNYSIQIDVMNSRPVTPMGVMLSSNSNGTYFTRKIEHTNRNYEGFVDFEKVSGIQGIFLVNTVKNFEEVEKSGKNEAKELITQITFDDGRNFQKLKLGDEELHLHSVTWLTNSGRVFSSPAPGLVMGIGNTGDYLKSYQDGNLYVSDDAGVTWREGLKGPHKYEFGDSGSILVAIKDEGATDEVRYSLDHGKEWRKVEIEYKIKPMQLTTTKDSTSLKFLLEGIEDETNNPAGFIIALDFDGMNERTCKKGDDDFEDWFARVNSEGEATCLMGHTQTYRRRKADADCFVRDEFEDPVPRTTNCTCTVEDFECDFNFVRDGDECIPSDGAAIIIPDGACDAFDDETTFPASSGWRKIPGNTCDRVEGEKQKDDPVERKCSEAAKPPSSGKVISYSQPLLGSIITYMYLERTGASTGEDETVLLQTTNGIFLSHDHGKEWKQIKELMNNNIEYIVAHPYFNDVVFFITDSETVFYSVDRGENIRSFKATYRPSRNARKHRRQVMNFHPRKKEWIILIGEKDCGSKEGCHDVASLTKDRGDNWQTLQRYVQKCEFIREPANSLKDKADREARERLIYCEVFEEEKISQDNPVLLVSSDNFFESRETHFSNVVDFATMSEFLIVATRDQGADTLKAAASVDGQTFAAANFPHGFEVPHQTAYTVLDSSTHSVFLHVTVNNVEGLEYGTIIKSNSNGTSYALSLNAVDRDRSGYVDFEKIVGIEGLTMVNVVANYDAKNYAKEGKKLKTMITHNDGAEWDYMQPPTEDAEGKNFDCSGDLNKCSLNIHSYTERIDKTDTFYSTSAIGLIIGNGNVGEYLTDINDADTFMTSDAGITWKAAKKGRYMWGFGDQGSILVLVREGQVTNNIHYSLNEGDTWLDYQFADHEVEVLDLTTVPSGNSRNFLLWTIDGGKPVTINLDFTGLTDKQCKLDENDVTAGDYYIWTPKHPNQDNDCLFGHVSQYHRKKTTAECYNGRMIPRLHDIAENCSCTRRDYECDYNYERQIDGSCKLVNGLQPADHKEMCLSNPDLEEYNEVTGYRRIPITTCQNGIEFDVSDPKPCPGHEKDFDKKHGPSAIGIFFAITIPIAVATGVGYWVWRNWASNFGQIRLGEQSSFDGEAPWVKYPVMALAGLVAVAQALPLLVASLWRSVSSLVGGGASRRFTTRDSFARGRGDYAIVDEDEGELLGDESDDEV